MNGTSGDGSYQTALCGGRAIAWSEYGDPAGRPVIYYHDAGSSRLECALLHDAAIAAGLRMLAVDLPGSGRTDPIPKRRLGRSVEEDMRMVLSAGDIHRAVFVGRGTGAMYAWAAASEHPDRVAGVVAISAAVPTNREDVRAALPLRFRAGLTLAERAPTFVASVRQRRLVAIGESSGRRSAVREARHNSRADAQLVADDGVFRLLRDARLEGARQGADGGEEIALRMSPWGFDPATLSRPSTVVYGEDDAFGPAIKTWLVHSPRIDSRVVAAGSLLIADAAGRAAIVAAISQY